MRKFFIKKYNPVHLPRWLYIAGETLTPGAASTVVTIPSDADIIEIAANGEDVYYAINAVFAGLASPGYIASGGREIVGPLGNWTSLYIYQVAGGTTHIQWFREG